MKTETKIKDITATLVADKAATLKRIPLERREMAKRSIEIAEQIALIAAKLGGYYSGNTSTVVRWGGSAAAETITSTGGQYSRKCTYRKTNATHSVTVTPAGIVTLVESEALREASIRDGLPLIDLREDGSCVWVRTNGKAIVVESGWVVWNAQLCYYSQKSAAHAKEGFERKLLAAHSAKTERRARLIVRLCRDAVATIADAERLGYCAPGIRAFQEKHGIGESASLPELISTGNTAAVALALSIARKLSRKKTLQATSHP